jgi:hypothetical protein
MVFVTEMIIPAKLRSWMSFGWMALVGPGVNISEYGCFIQLCLWSVTLLCSRADVPAYCMGEHTVKYFSQEGR